jgi:hypothetical protein
MMIHASKMRIFAATVSAVALLQASVVVAADGRNCDNNAIVYCGAQSTGELAQIMQSGDGRHADIVQIYAQYGISQDKVAQAVNGQVTKDGRVLVDNKVVATGAMTVGRQDMPGSTKVGSIFSRPPSVSFRQNALDAFVYMPGGQFAWAIIKSCGNPVAATPVAAVQAAAVAPAPPAVTPPPAAPLPQTGSASLIGITGSILMGYTVRAYLKSRSRLKQAMIDAAAIPR